ncbi:MAG: hypothetical protein IK151_04330 [Erysipelotrichaceae bacterium]|nr:hypothetical protein [Erysipelotrichaceae bacterium]
MNESKLDNHIYRYVCEVCGKVEYLSPKEAYEKGWDYPPFIGEYGIVSPRTCPYCDMMDTAWAALVLHGKNVRELSDKQKEAIIRIINEPGSIEVIN